MLDAKDELLFALAEALRLTQEYVGDRMLPAKPGWSWFDALDRYYRETGKQGGYWQAQAEHYQRLFQDMTLAACAEVSSGS